MRSTKSIILIVVALGCGLIASIGISQVLSRPETTAETESIYVTATSVQSWSKLSAQHVKKEDWPVDKIPQGAARTLEEFEGMSPRYPLYAGEPIIINKLSDGNGKIASERIPEGHQVFAVKVDKESALSGLISPGDRVDVLVFIRSRGGADQISTGTQTIMRNATVFAVNDQIARDNDGKTSLDAKTVSLLVLPEQSERLLLAKQLGTIHLALRKPGDESDINTDGARPRDLYDESTEGSDGMIADTNEPKPNGGIFDILKEMKGATSTAVDTSNAPQASGATSTMVIMSPDGVLGTYSFARDSTQGGLPALPTELLGAGDDASEAPPTSEPTANTNTDEAEADAGEGNAPTEDDSETVDDVVGPAELGL